MGFYSAEISYLSDSAKFYAALADMEWPIWLDSGGMSRFDIITAAPNKKLVMDMSNVQRDPFEWVREELGNHIDGIEGIPFAGGALGYWSYDLAFRSNSIATSGSVKAFNHPPLMAIGIYDWALVVDHVRNTAKVVSHRRFGDTEQLLKKIVHRLQSAIHTSENNFKVAGKITSNFTQSSYAEAFAEVQQYLKSGDCYQINLAQRFSAAATGDSFGAYLALRKLSPAPYSAFIKLPEVQVLCASPERFLRVLEGKVESRPIKGTRPRDENMQKDRLLAENLQQHTKDRAENLMIVDMLRNDLGKSCIPGSVVVPKLFEVESYSNVHHLVSSVEGIIRGGRDAIHVLRDCFPGASVTGAPKRRAMEIIEQLEPSRRGIYCGSIGYIGFDGNMDSNIVIRTMVYLNNEIHCWAGGGIVADSEKIAEYQETMDKASAMLKVLELYGGKL